MEDANKTGGSFKKVVAGTVLFCGIVGGGILLERRYDVTGKITNFFWDTREKVVEIITTNPYEATAKLMESIEQNKDDVSAGKYSIGEIVDKINSFRPNEELNNDAVEQITKNNTSVYQKTIDNLIGMAGNERNGYIAEKSFGSLDAEKKYTFLEKEAINLPEEKAARLALKSSEKFSKETYEALIPELYRISGEKFGNKYQIFVNLFKDQKEKLKDLIDRSSELYKKGMEKGKRVIDNYLAK